MATSSQEPQAREERARSGRAGPGIELGALAQDTELGRAGVVVGHDGVTYQLRPIRGGLVWNVLPEHVRQVNASDLLREKVRQANRRSIGSGP
ncbi:MULTISPECIES: hypothetical protein [unclassified Streptomyces]|uniref:Transposase n=1 Tax=Streptomyces johnsoniae TaxID=3075532 RepID=A0ABU2RYG0_9ACTN|nr:MULTISPECIES: hypothetical protein [unclassified Streptomyces]MDT0441778.1 hypothetical protein [Streptomyces sp. DSM 41886]ONK13713.1 hypothetical protein STBA_44860 [Streptomyces sp. MP131-18]